MKKVKSRIKSIFSKDKLSVLINKPKVLINKVLRIFKKIKWRRETTSLLSLIRKKRKEVCTKDKKRFIRSFSNLYIPSFKSFFIIAILIALILSISHSLVKTLDFFAIVSLNDLFSGRLSSSSNPYQNLIAIHAGIGVIIFALIIFIAGSARDDEEKYRARVLLKESFLFPLTVAEIMIFFLLIWRDILILSFFIVFIISLFAIWSLGRVISTLINSYRFAQKRVEVIKDRLQQSIRLAVDERLGNSILLRMLSANNIKLKYHFFSIDNKNEYYCFNAEKKGIIVDINIRRLEEFADVVEEEAYKNGFAFTDEERGKVETESDFTTEATQEVEKRTLKPNSSRYLLKKFQDFVSEDSNTLICVDRTLITDNQIILKLEKIFNRMFTIKNVDSFAEEIRYDLAKIKDQFISALSKEHLGKIDELVKFYFKLAEGFLEYMERCGGGYTFKLALEERHSLLGGWQEVKWLSTDVREIFNKAIQLKNKDIWSDIIYLPFGIAGRAIKSRDHYLFHEFIWFAEYIYYSAIKQKDDYEFLVERTWRHLKELASFYIESDWNRDDLSEEDIRNLKDFSIYFYLIFQNLLKSAFDKKDINSFLAFKKTVFELFKYFKSIDLKHDLSQLKWEIENLEFTDSERKKKLDLIKRIKRLQDTNKEIENRKYQMLFGLSSWIFNLYQKNNSDVEISKFYGEIQSTLPSDVKKLTDIFLSAHTFDVEEFWGWSHWEMKTNGEVQFIRTLEYLEKFYAIKTLSLLSTKTDDEVREISLPHNRDLTFLSEGSRDLIKILDDISDNSDKWEFVLTEQAINKVSLFKELLNKAKESQENEELEIIRKKSISKNKIIQFKKEVIKGFYDSVILRSILNYLNLYEDQSKKATPKDIKRFGFNIVDDKAAFFEDWHVHYGNWGRDYGRNLGQSENLDIIKKISEHCEEESSDNLEEVLEKFDIVEDIIVLSKHGQVYDFFSKSKNFIPKWSANIKKLPLQEFAGYYKFKKREIPVFKIIGDKDSKSIFILNKRKIGKLIQYSPIIKGEDKDLVIDIFYINIQVFSENEVLLDEFIQNPPSWLEKVGNLEKQKDHLKERVLTHVFERYEFQIDDEFKGVKFTFDT